MRTTYNVDTLPLRKTIQREQEEQALGINQARISSRTRNKQQQSFSSSPNNVRMEQPRKMTGTKFSPPNTTDIFA